MALPTGLFVEAPEMQDTSLTQLGSDVESWPEEIVTKVKERVPQTAGMSILVKFMKQDDENGVATGSAIVSNEKKQVVIPIIIKDFMMYPLDIMIADSKLLPLTPDYFNAIFNSNEPFQRLEEYPTFGGLGRFEDANLWNATYPPSLGRYAYASAGFDILDQISDTLYEKDLVEFKEIVKNANIRANFHAHGKDDVIKKIAHIRPVNMNEFRQGADNLVKKDMYMLRREGPNKYSILSNSNGVFHPGIMSGRRDECVDMISSICDKAQDEINEVDQNGEKIIVINNPVAQEGMPYLDNVSSPKVEQAEEFDHYVVKNKAGVEFEGMVVPKVINFDMELVPLKLFLGKTMSTIQDQIAGVRVENSRWQLKGLTPQIGQTGTFFYRPHDNPSKCLATVPVTIKTVVQDPCGGIELKVVDLHGVTMKIRLSSDDMLQRIAPMGPLTYTLPKGFHWFPMEGFQEISNSNLDYGAKTASANPAILISTGYGQFAMKGVEKYASACGWNSSNLHGYQAKFLMASLGANVDNINTFIKQASRSGKATIHGLRRPQLTSEKIAAAAPKAEKLMKVARNLKCNLIKEASFIENSQTVDALLSLNFVNPENISKFVSKIGQLKAVVSTLANLIVGSRLGIREVPEQAASTAMYRLIDVINGLEALRATQEHPQG
jgi:hypothetical protein